MRGAIGKVGGAVGTSLRVGGCAEAWLLAVGIPFGRLNIAVLCELRVRTMRIGLKKNDGKVVEKEQHAMERMWESIARRRGRESKITEIWKNRTGDIFEKSRESKSRKRGC